MAASGLFEWEVGSAGYEWRVAKPFGENPTPMRFLVERRDPKRSAPPRVYDPLRGHPALYRTYASLSPTEDAVRVFANEYGLLGEWHSVDARADPGETWHLAVAGENMRLWMDNIHYIGRAAEVMDVLRSGPGATAKLGRNFLWHQDVHGRRMAVYDSRPDLEPGSRNRKPGEADPFQWPIGPEGSLGVGGSVQQLAWLFLRQFVTHHLQQHHRVSVGLVQLDANPASLRFMPATLMGCLWLQLAESISESREERGCVGCGRWFVIQGRVPSDKQFCTSACRVKTFRRRRREDVVKMHRKKVPVAEIAKKLNVDEGDVKKWIGASKKKGK